MKNMNFPKFIMKDILWSFDETKYENQDSFYDALNKYNQDITGDELKIDNHIGLSTKNLVFQFSYWDDDFDDTIEKEIILEADNVFFSKIELLFKIHNEVCNILNNQDHHFFEGLQLYEEEDPNYPNIPYYFLLLGS